MKEVIIGKEGTQKFAINAARVSRLHAKITILDNGQWVLEDLGFDVENSFLFKDADDFGSAGDDEKNQQKISKAIAAIGAKI